MHVLLWLGDFEETETTRLAYRLCQRWSPLRELTLSAVALGEEGPMEPAFRDAGLATHPLGPMVSGLPLARQRRLLSEKLEPPDLIHVFAPWPAPAVRQLLSTWPEVAVAFTIADLAEWRRLGAFRRWMSVLAERRTRPENAMFLPAFETVACALVPFALPRDRVEVVRPGVDAVQSFPLSSVNRERYRMLMGVPPEGRMVVCPSGCGEDGRIDLLLDAVARMEWPREGLRVFVVGEGPGRGAAAERAAQLHIEGAVRFIGPIVENLYKVLSAADVVVDVGCARGRFCLNAALAQSAGTPVVAVREGALAETVRDGETGFLVKARDPATMAAAIDRLLADESTREEMGLEARTHILEEFELGHTADRIIDVWRRLSPDAEWRATDTIPLEEVMDGEPASSES